MFKVNNKDTRTTPMDKIGVPENNNNKKHSVS